MPRNSVSASDIMEISEMYPGFRFSPTDIELISHYLKHKINGSDSSADVIAQVEICKSEPWDLPEKSIIKSDHEWFFFAPNDKKYPHGSQAKRATKVGFWKATGKERDVKSGKNVIGTKRALVFHLGRAPKGTRTDWIMHEYCLKEHTDDKCLSQESWVICRLRKQPDLPDRGARSTTSNVGEDLQPILEEARRDGEDGVVHSAMEDDCFDDILKDDIIQLDYSQYYGAPLSPNAAECSTVQQPDLSDTVFRPPVDHFQGNAQSSIRREIGGIKRNHGKMHQVSDKDSPEPDEVEGGHGDSLGSSLAKRKSSLAMTNGSWLRTIFVIMVVFTLFSLTCSLRQVLVG